MGKTIPSWRQIIEKELARWMPFRHALRKDDRQTFDDLINQCRIYASAAGLAALPIKTDGIFLSLLFSHHKMIRELQEKVEILRKRA